MCVYIRISFYSSGLYVPPRAPFLLNHSCFPSTRNEAAHPRSLFLTGVFSAISPNDLKSRDLPKDEVRSCSQQTKVQCRSPRRSTEQRVLILAYRGAPLTCGSFPGYLAPHLPPSCPPPPQRPSASLLKARPYPYFCFCACGSPLLLQLLPWLTPSPAYGSPIDFPFNCLRLTHPFCGSPLAKASLLLARLSPVL